ncbi:hypothetical protein AAF712_010915 [Marasmius tenuissimus]|uniref:Bicarbonate transporter-like transmembrane domain-containing protein n=1 Tax=Marasmius tenuissimus TaxID=585030 RepID=A0ABR2ZLJ8_9AGAR
MAVQLSEDDNAQLDLQQRIGIANPCLEDLHPITPSPRNEQRTENLELFLCFRGRRPRSNNPSRLSSASQNGFTTFISGLLGLPAPNGLIPQAPIPRLYLSPSGRDEKSEKNPELDPIWHEEPVAVVEQRVSNLAQGSLCLVLLTGLFLHVLNLIPRAGSWGLTPFALTGFSKSYYLFRDKKLTSKDDPLRRVRKSRLILFLLIQLIGFGATFAITQTIAAIGFPVVIMLLIPIRTVLIPRLPFTDEELAILDGPTAFPFKQEFELGQHLRQRYLTANSSNFISTINNSIVNLTQVLTRADACGEGGVILNSAMSLTQGLYPANNAHTTKLANGTTVEGPLNGYQVRSIVQLDKCGAFDKATKEFYASAEFKQKADEASSYLSQLSQYNDGRPVTLENMPFLSLFNMTGIAKAQPELAGFVHFAGSIALEVRQPADGSAPVVRFNFKNGTDDAGASQLGNNKDRGCGEPALATMEGQSQASSSHHQTISPVGTGFLGAGLTLFVAIATLPVLFFLGLITFGKKA